MESAQYETEHLQTCYCYIAIRVPECVWSFSLTLIVKSLRVETGRYVTTLD